MYCTHIRSGCSAARVAYLNGVQVVAGSNPVIPTNHLAQLRLGFFVSQNLIAISG